MAAEPHSAVFYYVIALAGRIPAFGYLETGVQEIVLMEKEFNEFYRIVGSVVIYWLYLYVRSVESAEFESRLYRGFKISPVRSDIAVYLLGFSVYLIGVKINKLAGLFPYESFAQVAYGIRGAMRRRTLVVRDRTLLPIVDLKRIYYAVDIDKPAVYVFDLIIGLYDFVEILILFYVILGFGRAFQDSFVFPVEHFLDPIEHISPQSILSTLFVPNCHVSHI